MLAKSEEIIELKKDIATVDNQIQDKRINKTKIEKIQKDLDIKAKRLQYDESLGSKRFLLYELQGIIDLANGNTKRAKEFFDEAKSFMSKQDKFVSKAATEFCEPKDEHKPTNISKFNNKIGGWLLVYAFRLVVFPLILLFDVVYSNTASKNVDIQYYMNAARVTEIILILFSLVVSVYFFMKIKYTKPLVIVLEIQTALVYLIFYFWILHLSSKYKTDTTTTTNLLSYAIVSCIWLLYWVKSSRVKKTFIK